LDWLSYLVSRRIGYLRSIGNYCVCYFRVGGKKSKAAKADRILII
jgi:hypothetical protein